MWTSKKVQIAEDFPLSTINIYGSIKLFIEQILKDFSFDNKEFSIIRFLVVCELDYKSLVFQLFQKFIKKYTKKYESINEYRERFKVFRQNLLKFQTNKIKELVLNI